MGVQVFIEIAILWVFTLLFLLVDLRMVVLSVTPLATSTLLFFGSCGFGVQSFDLRIEFVLSYVAVVEEAGDCERRELL